MQIAQVLSHLESLAPLDYQEKYDNAGLLTGRPDGSCTGALVTLDATEEVVMEAIARGCNLIIAHHPIIFGGLKKINGKNYVERTVIAAIKQDIAIYAIHTNLDNVVSGVNGKMAERLGLVATHPLMPREGSLKKLYCFVPTDHLNGVRDAIFLAGAGHIGHYSECSWQSEGWGTFKGGKDTQPFIGQPALRHEEKESRLEVILSSHLTEKVVEAMIKAHPYEEVAYDIIDLYNTHPGLGAGLIGTLPEPMEEMDFLSLLKETFGLRVIRHTPLRGRPVSTCAICGGAGSFLISKALAKGADIFVTADVKYHEFFDAEGRMVIADIGHYESEQFTIDLLVEVLKGKFPNFAVLKSEVVTNPVRYF